MKKHLIIEITPEELSELIQSSVEASLSKFKEELQPNDPDELMSRKEAAKYLQISLTTLWHWMRDGKVKYYKNGSKIYFKRQELVDSLNQTE